jgi:F-type H+-transporting ATPase subunit alpha
LDENTRKIIEHGKRIRACLKQPQFDAVSVPQQIIVLLALTANLFDAVPFERMTQAEQAVREAATKIPPEILARFETAAKLSDEDRKAVTDIATAALIPFQAKPDSKPIPETDPKPKATAVTKPKTPPGEES